MCQIVKAIDAIRRKHGMLKRRKEAVGTSKILVNPEEFTLVSPSHGADFSKLTETHVSDHRDHRECA